MSQPELSVVVACSGGEAIDAGLARLREACQGIPAEFIVVSAGPNPALVIQRRGWDELRTESLPSGTLTPVLWGAGLQLAGGRHVAFTTSQLRVERSWARALLSGLAAGAAGAGGPIVLGPEPDVATAAAYFIRFSAFTPWGWPAAGRASDIPGDNAAYRRDALLRHADLLREGFWEVEFHRRFAQEKLYLQMVPEASASLVGPVSLSRLLRQRYRHARQFGRVRVRDHHESALQLLLLAPLVPPILLARLVQRAWAGRGERRWLLLALPWLVLLTLTWAAGEAAGAVTARRADPD